MNRLQVVEFGVRGFVKIFIFLEFYSRSGNSQVNGCIQFQVTIR